MNFTEEQILALAPDDASKKAGKDLANPAKWVTRGLNEKAMWGECQGSGSKPYQTQIDIEAMAFKCSCPSRKFPCKHGLGLLMLHVKHPGIFSATEPPAWVAEWMAKRSETAEKKAEKKEAPVDEVAQAKRLQAREKSVENGITELLLWIKDIIRNGILSIPEKGPAYFLNMAKRMVDAKATGLANMVKELGQTHFYTESWQHEFIDQLARIYMVANGYQHKDALPDALIEDIRSRIGFTQSQDELKEKDGITDIWIVLAKQVTEEDNITTERNWLYGSQTRQYALVLQFSVRGQGVPISLTPGMLLQAELAFYPSAQPLRAIIKKHATSQVSPRFPGFTDWPQINVAIAKRNASLPFSVDQAFVIENITPVFYNNEWWLADTLHNMVQIKQGYKNIFPLLAASGGHAFNMAVIGSENSFEPLGIWQDKRYMAI